MARFNTTAVRPAVASPVTTTGPAYGAGGQPGHLREAHGELFLLGVALLQVGKDTFHERGDARVQRFIALVHELATTDPAWLVNFLPWLRNEGNLRSATVVGAAEFVAARRGLPDPDGYGWRCVDGVLQRADEPGEILAYWTSRYGMALPKGLKRGVGLACARLYDEYAYAKYDRADAAFRFARVLDLTHPTCAMPGTAVPTRRALFPHAHGAMRGRPPELAPELAKLRARAELTGLPVEQRRAVLTGPGGTERLRAAGMTWEAVAGWLHGPLDAAAWTALIPTMGYHALVKNLRNFDDAGVDDSVAAQVGAKLADPARVAKARVLPFQLYGAHKAVRSLRWGHFLEQALQACLPNIPALPGRTLVVVDQSPSMFPGYGFSTKQVHEHISNAELAALFGTAIAMRAHAATLAGYGGESYRVPFGRGDALLRVMGGFRVVNGTNTFGAVRDHFAGHDRVLIVTDEQNTHGPARLDDVLPANVPAYTWNIGGYRVGATSSGTGLRHTFGGLTDVAFRTVPLLEAGRSATWPWASRA